PPNPGASNAAGRVAAALAARHLQPRRSRQTLHQPMRQRRRLPRLPGAQDLVTATSLLLLLHRMNGGFMGFLVEFAGPRTPDFWLSRRRRRTAMDTFIGIAI